MKKQREQLKDFLADIDAVLNDCSVERQQQLKKIEDLVFNPTQCPFVCNPSANTRYWEDATSARLQRMGQEPTAEDAEAAIEGSYYDVIGYWIGAFPHYNWPEETGLQKQAEEPELYMVVDSITYEAMSNRPMATMKEIHQW